MDKKKMAKALEAALLVSAKGHGVTMTQEEAKGIAANLAYCVEEVLDTEADEYIRNAVTT